MIILIHILIKMNISEDKQYCHLYLEYPIIDYPWAEYLFTCYIRKENDIIMLINIMQLKTWLLVIRILNILCAALMTGFSIWYIMELFNDNKGFFTVVIRIFVPIFVILLAITIITAEFKYSKAVQHFKFLQFLPGLILFNLFVASLFAFQFSTLSDEAATIAISVVFCCLAITFSIMYCLKPQGTESLLAADD